MEVPKNAVGKLNVNEYNNRTDEVDEMDETLEDGFKDYSKKRGPSKGVHAYMGSGARSSEDRGGNSNVEDDTTCSKLTYKERFIFEVLKQYENKSTMVRDMGIEKN